MDSAALERCSSAYDEYPLSRRTMPKIIESNQQAVISALKNLQEKILKLELERKLEENHLFTENKPALKAFQKQTELSHQNQRLTTQLDSAQSRCQLLERELSYVRMMLNHTDKGRSVSRENGIINMERKFQQTSPNEYENFTEAKIQDLEEKLKMEQRQRHLVEKKAQEFQKAARKNPSFSFSAKQPRKVHTCVSLKTSHVKRSATHGLPHYKLNLKNIPFIAGKATTPSYNIGSNVQEVISLLKTHNPRLCSLFGQPHTSKGIPPHRRHSAPIKSVTRPVEKSSSKLTYKYPVETNTKTISVSELSDLLAALQDEFGSLFNEQQDKLHHINEETNHYVKKKLEKELEDLTKRIDAKQKQIMKLKSYLEIVNVKTRQKGKEDTGIPISVPVESSESDEVLVTTTVKTKGRRAQKVQVGSIPSRDLQLKMYHDIKTLQTTLKKDDIVWE